MGRNPIKVDKNKGKRLHMEHSNVLLRGKAPHLLVFNMDLLLAKGGML